MKKINFVFSQQKKLRYGENPHQKGWVAQEKTQDPLAYFNFHQLQGKELSFNNYLDVDAGIECLSFIGQKQPACVVVKHANPCGACQDQDPKKAFQKAWAGDSLAAFGGIVALNRKVDRTLAELMLKNNKFFEILLCPNIDKKAEEIFRVKKNLRILINPHLRKPRLQKTTDFKKIRGGVLIQEADIYQLKSKNLKVMTRKKPTLKQLKDLLFAWNICHVSKANAIAIVKNQQLIASGVGQQDRVRCCQLAVNKAAVSTQNSVAASDAFFPFKDAPEVLIKAGIRAIIQPGGSIRDQETVDLCNRHRVAMIYTQVRCFKH